MSQTAKSNCNCCSGTSVQTPQAEFNAPGLSAISYRVGIWSAFKESMLARLSSADYPALAALKTRKDDDFTIAFIDASAIVLDILTFYQERLANESYLRTAMQLRSLVEMSRLIGYQPAPAVSAAVYLAFTLKTTPGQAPDPATPSITIPKGTQVQSVPTQDQKPQTFETSADVQAKADWNALQVRAGQPWSPAASSSLYLSGTTTQLQQGDSLLILGSDRETVDPNVSRSDDWDVVVLNKVQVDKIRNFTYVEWNERIAHIPDDGTPRNASNWNTAKVFAFRQKCGLFGNNAPSPNLFVAPNDPQKNTSLPDLIYVPSSPETIPWSWKNYQIHSSDQIDLDAPYRKIVAGSWFALTVRRDAPNPAGEMTLITTPNLREEARLYKAVQVRSVSLASFGMSGKVTELAADYRDSQISTLFPLQLSEVWAQSEELSVIDQPLDHPLYGAFIDLEDARPDLLGAQVIAVFGKRQKLRVVDGATGLSFVPDYLSSKPQPTTIMPGDIFTLIAATPVPLKNDGSIPQWRSSTNPLTLKAEDANGRTGTIQNASLSIFCLAPSDKTDPDVSEYALVESVTITNDVKPRTRFTLKSSLANYYDRAATTVNANVALATHGQSVGEIMGNGSAATPNQSFLLKHAPVTFVQAPTPTGRQSTLQVRANGMAWTEVPSLYQQGPSQQVYSTLNQSDGSVDVIFGDGVEGSTLPTGQNNIQSSYRFGSGSVGNVGAGTLSTLMDRPLGVSGVTNPEQATGGQDADTLDDIRACAPKRILSLGRAVSLADYQSFAANFAGIEKAHAIWIPRGRGRGVFLTVAGVAGATLPDGSPTLVNLAASLQNFGNPLIPITVMSFLETLFGISARIKYDPAYDATAVQAQVLKTLYQTYSFDRRTFGQGVSVDEASSIIQAVPGVVAVTVPNLSITATSRAGDLAGKPRTVTLSSYNDWLAQKVPQSAVGRADGVSLSRICAYLPAPSLNVLPYPAEILVLDPNPNSIQLGVMP